MLHGEALSHTGRTMYPGSISSGDEVLTALDVALDAYRKNGSRAGLAERLIAVLDLLRTHFRNAPAGPGENTTKRRIRQSLVEHLQHIVHRAESWSDGTLDIHLRLLGHALTAAINHERLSLFVLED